ncbi:MAG TPA: histidinol-phosphate transaminase [Oribacterium sp.]|nr:histidinol-phosphate transaminase [Oribacterium sp.]
MSKFFHSAYRNLTPYTPGEQPQDKKYIKLNTNESPFPPAPGVIEAVNASEAMDLRLYSDPELKPLKAQLAESFGVDTANVFIGNGSDECLNYAFMAFGEDGFAFPDITYSFYKVIAELNHVQTDVKPLRADFTIDLSDYLGPSTSEEANADAGKTVVKAEGNQTSTGAQVDADKAAARGEGVPIKQKIYTGIGKAIVLPNPNAPTGIPISLDAVAALCEANPDHVVMIDEAYVDFADTALSAVPLTKKYKNLLVTQTFSKSRSMAGARVGFAIGDAALIQDLETLRNSNNPYNVNRISMKCAIEALKDTAYFEENCAKIRANRAWTKAALEELGFHVLKSQTNFLFAESPEISGKELYLRLKDNGVLVRHFDDPKITNFNRITIGSREEMEQFIETVKEILSF